MNHKEPYSDKYLKDILQSVKTIAMVGASPDKTKFSDGVVRVRHETGYEMIHVNPRREITEIRKIKVYKNLEASERKAEMVEVVRKEEERRGVEQEAMEIRAKV